MGENNWGKDPYYIVLSKPHSSLKFCNHIFESIDNQYNCLGIDEQEAKKYINHANDNGANWANVHSPEEQRYGQERSSQVLEYTSKLHDPFNIYNEINFSHKLPYLKQKEDSSEDIIVVNDSDNEIIVPLEMEVQHLDQSDGDFGH